MRKMISGLVAAVAVMAAAPAMACGYSGCWQPQAYVAPVATYGYSGCNSCGGGWGTRMAMRSTPMMRTRGASRAATPSVPRSSCRSWRMRTPTKVPATSRF